MEDLSLGRSVSHEEALLRRMSEEHADRLRSRHVGQDVDYPYMDGPEDLRCVNRDYLLKLHAFLHKVDLFCNKNTHQFILELLICITAKHLVVTFGMRQLRYVVICYTINNAYFEH